MIDTNGLMLGSIVMSTHSKELYEVVELNEYWIESRLIAPVKAKCTLVTHNPKYLSSIPLTREVLQACEGYVETSWGVQVGDTEICMIDLCYDEDSGDFHEAGSGAWMLYLHELQMLYYAYYGKSLSIDVHKLINNKII